MSESNIEKDRIPTYHTPRWVKVMGMVVLILIVMVGIMMLSGGEHGPSRHMPQVSVTESGDAGGHTPPIQHGANQP